MSRTHLLQVAASRPAPPGGRRVGGAEVERRLKIVEEQLARGAPRSEIIASTGLPARTVDGYLKRVRESWRDDAHEGRQDLRSRSLSRLMALRARLLEARAWSALVALERLIADVEGVRGAATDGPTKETTGVAGSAHVLSTESMHERVPLLIQACLRLAQRQSDDRLDEALHVVLLAGMSDLQRRHCAEPDGRAHS